MSEADIDPGTRSVTEIAEALAGIKIGISCLTPENLREPWLLFEAGALSKTIDDKTRLCTYLLADLRPQDVTPPLGMFQATQAQDIEQNRRLVHLVNRTLNEPPLPEATLNKLFELAWPQLQGELKRLPKNEEGVLARRSSEDMLAEVLEIVRTEATKRWKIDALDPFISVFEELLPALPQIREAIRRINLPIPQVAGLPALPSATYPLGAIIHDTITSKAYRNISDQWREF